MAIVIQGGTYQNLQTGVWIYPYTDNAGEHFVTFTAHRTPRIGDTIVNGVLVDAVLPISNQDKSKWLPKQEGEWPEYK